MKHYEPGQSVLVRKQIRQPYAHEGVVIRKVSKHTYEEKLDRMLCQYNQSHLKPNAKEPRPSELVDDCDLDELAHLAYDEAGDTRRFATESSQQPSSEPIITQPNLLM